MSFCFESMGSVIGRLPTHGPTLGLRMWRKSAVECCLMADQVIRHRCRRDRAAVGGEVVLFIVFPTHTDIVFGVGGNLIRQPPMGWPEKAAIMGRGGGGGGGRRSQHPVYCSPHGPGTESHPATAPRSADHGSLFSASAHRQSPGPWAAASGCPPEPPPTAKSARDGGAADATPPPVRQTLMTSQFEKERPRLVC